MVDNKADIAHRQSTWGIWALSFGCCIGWGCFVMPGTTFLPVAGLLGTAIAIVLSGLIMVVISANYHYMINRFPNNGGSYSYAKEVFGDDHGYLCAWFLRMAYVAIIWANATAFIQIFRRIFGIMLNFGFHYQLANYDIYCGEVLATLGLIVFFGIAAIRAGKIVRVLNTIMGIILLTGVLLCFTVACFRGNVSFTFQAIADEKLSVSGILNIMALAPWAFIGFEVVSNVAAEYKFSPKKIFRLLVLSIVSGSLCYILMTFLATMMRPEGFDSLTSYIGALETLNDKESMPTLFVMNTTAGKPGLALLSVTALSALGTTLLGYYRATGRLTCILGENGILPTWFSRKNRFGNPGNAIFYIMLISMIGPFLGRTAVGWITDITTISAGIAYGYTSAATYIMAKKENHPLFQVTGLVGLVCSCFFVLFLVCPTRWAVLTPSAESFLILMFWSILGAIYFNFVFDKDQNNRFGKSTVVWLSLVFLIFFSSLMWMQQSIHENAETAIEEIDTFHNAELTRQGIDLDDHYDNEEKKHLKAQMDSISTSLLWHSLMQMTLIILALLIMFRIYAVIQKRESNMNKDKIKAEESNKAKSAFLFNMSHDLRTPMNAIIGFTELAQRKGVNEAQMHDYLRKIDASSQHLLTLINDILEMSRIENGKMQLKPVPTDLVKIMDEMQDMFALQMEMKHIQFTLDASNIKDRWVMCDKKHFDSILLNLISNACKYTMNGGMVEVRLHQLCSTGEGGNYELLVKDTGIGMSKEFVAKLFEPFEREQTSTVSGIQGTGLGMAITKRIIDMMNASITVSTEPGKGTKFVVSFFLKRADAPQLAIGTEPEAASKAQTIDILNTRVLLVEDNEINREIATMMLEEIGFQLDIAENGKIAVDKVVTSSPTDTYKVILMDIQMPEMNGYEATKLIRSLEDPRLSQIPIIAMTANAFQEDIQNAMDAGMDGHIAKPIDSKKLKETVIRVLQEKGKARHA